jgi:hypothetical protein
VATITADELAVRFLKAIGADYTNANLRRAVRIWKASEGRSICGNNPWFIRFSTFNKNRDGSIANRLCVNKSTRQCVMGVSGPQYDCNFSQFKTLDDGIWATVQVLQFPRYQKVVAALRAGNALQFLRELGASGWAAGGYNNALVVRYGQLVATYNWTLTLVAGSVDTNDPGASPVVVGAVTGAAAATPQTIVKLADGVLGGWGNQIVFAEDHILTTEDVQSIMTTLVGNGWFNNADGSLNTQAVETARVILLRHVGEKWNKALQVALQKEFFNAATEAANPLSAVAQSLSGFMDVLRKLFDPQTYVRTGALVLGLILFITGFKMLMDATSGTAARV